MTTHSINRVSKSTNEIPQMTVEQRTPEIKPILEFANNNNEDNWIEISEAKLTTEIFKSKIMNRLDTSKSKHDSKTTEYYLNMLIECAQKLNGVQKNNLKPQGNAEQNAEFNKHIMLMVSVMKDCANFVASGLSIEQDPKTGLYKLNVNNKLFDIPERKVEIVEEDTYDGTELVPQIVD